MSAKRVSQHLAPETDAEDRHSTAVGLDEKGCLGGNQRGDVAPVHRPIGPQRDNQAHILGEVMPAKGVFPRPQFECPPDFAETFDNDSTVVVSPIGDQHRAHTGTVIPNGGNTNLA